MNALRRRATAGAVVAGLLAGLVAAGPARAAGPVVLAQGHTDAIDVHYADGRLELRVNDDTVSPPVPRAVGDVTFQVLPGARTEVPDLPAFAFLGAPGTPIWMLPQVQDPALLWPGWNTTALAPGTFRGDGVRLSLVGVDGPGAVTVFDTSSLGEPNIRFRSTDGLPDSIDVPVHTHAHASWVFGATGRYTLTFQVDATLADGTALSTGPVPYRFVVGDAAEEPVSLSISGLAASYRPGETVTLQAVQTPRGPSTGYRWSSRPAGADAFTEIAGETGAAYRFTATEALDRTEYRVGLADGTSSPPVTLRVTSAPAPEGTSKSVTASIDPSAGALVISVLPEDRTVTLPPAALSPGGDAWETGGALRPVTVTDTRTGTPGWTVSGQVSGGFRATTGASFGAEHLGWTPAVVSQGAGQGVVAGPVATPGGSGLGTGAPLATAPAGRGRGTARLDAQLRLRVPTETAAGTYTGTLTLTVI
ncbi:choice-of-anchor M domain-containing protein [Catenuloplanes atrovinosus]|uniref:Surface-anchored protein n=1 Tax=Catenuloplanes atrovinosus TaxID=137266 RepID=A0AAE3YSH0_9ACTN|nr:choice-of-anchor M domain-containing protein [Catenuloplanes atrovinosus]MDR7277539.1 surface-anchored protein [Catenuloplanes atrovinosus]